MYFYEKATIEVERNESITRDDELNSNSREKERILALIKKYGVLTNGLLKSIIKSSAKQTLLQELYRDGKVIKLHLKYSDDEKSMAIYALPDFNESEWSVADILSRLSLFQAANAMGVINHCEVKGNVAVIKNQRNLISIRRNDLSFPSDKLKGFLLVLEDEEMATEIYNEIGESFAFITDEMTSVALDTYLSIEGTTEGYYINEYQMTCLI